MKRRLITILLVLAMVIGMMPMAMAATTALPEPVDNVITLTDDVVLSGDSTLDLTGKTVVTNGHSITIGSGTTTITGGTFNNTVEGILKKNSEDKVDHARNIFIVANGATLNLTGSKVNTAAFAPIYVLGVCNLESTDICTTVANNNYDSRAMLVVQGANAKLNMKSGSITMEPSTVMSDGMYGIYAYQGASVTLGDESTHTGPTVATHFAALGVNHETAPSEWKIYGGEYTSTAKATTEWWKYFCGALYLAGSCKMDIYGGSFSGGNYTVCMPWADADVKLNIHGGSFTETDGDGILYYRKNTAATTQTMPVVSIDDGTFFGPLFAGNFYNSLPIVKGGAYTALASAMSFAKDNTTIKLADDITVDYSIELNTYSANPITLDLNGHNIRFAKNQHFYIEGGNLTLTGEGTVEESVPNYAPILMKGSLWDKDYSVVNVGKDVTLRGWAGVFVDQNGARNAGIVANVDGKLEGVYDAGGNMGSGIYVNGQITEQDIPVKITLGETAEINAAGDGMYLAGYAETTIANGAKIIGSNTGVEIRAGKLTVNGGTITGNAMPTESDSNGNGATTAGAGIAVAQHTTKLPIDVQINGGEINGYTALYEKNTEKNSDGDIAKVSVTVNDGKFAAINGGVNAVYSEDCVKFLKGGHYTTDPSAYKAEGYSVVPSTVEGYVYTLVEGDVEETTVVVKDSTNAAADLADNEALTEETKTAIENAMPKASVDGTAEAVDNKDAILKAADVDKAAADVVEINVSVSVTATDATVDASNAITSLTFEAKPEATVKVDGVKKVDEKGDAVKVPVENSYLNGKPITVKLPLPAGFDSSSLKEIMHITSDGTRERFLPEGSGAAKTFRIDENNCAVVEITKFSTFILNTQTTTVAKIGDVAYGTLQEAIDAAKDGETITLVGNSDENVTIAGKSLIIDKNNFALDGEITLGSYCTMTDADGKVTVRYNPPATPIEAGTPAQMPFQEVAKRFDDVPADAWFATGVYYAAENGLMNGTGNNLFSPYANTTRGMIMTILARRSGVNTAGSTPWYAAGMNWAKSAGVSDGTNPTAAVTREQLVAMLFRYAAFNGMDAVTLEENLGQFADRESVSGWAVSAMNWAVGQGLVEGSNGLLRPKATATRAEVATILMRFCALLKK